MSTRKTGPRTTARRSPKALRPGHDLPLIDRDYDLRERPIPKTKRLKTALDYHQIPIDLGGRLNQEPLVDVSDYGISFSAAYNRQFAAAIPSVLVRESVAAGLAGANEFLRPYGVELQTLDGWRSIELQLELWDYFIKQGRETLTNPIEHELVQFAGQFCSDPRSFDPDDYRTWPVHNTGGAVDLSLQVLRGARSKNRTKQLFMGGDFDDTGPESSTRYYEGAASSTGLEARRARGNRRLLHHAMEAAGFVNYPHEWWHYDFGTQMWVMNGGYECAAFYGRATLDMLKKK